jgi:hypothetical protein
MLYVRGSAVLIGGATYGGSDRRLKRDILPYPDHAIEVIDKLKPVTFEWKHPKDVGMRGRQIGFVAQDVQPVVPEAAKVSDDPEKTLGLKYDALIPVLTKALQELKATNQALHAEVDKLEADHARLEQEIQGR